MSYIHSDPNYVTDVGAFTQAGSYYGTFDQAGNLQEWNDTVIASSRGMRGGEWADNGPRLRATGNFAYTPTSEGAMTGFRVGTVPEPNTAALALFGAIFAIRRRANAAP